MQRETSTGSISLTVVGSLACTVRDFGSGFALDEIRAILARL
jgi:hypothetical protein